MFLCVCPRCLQNKQLVEDLIANISMNIEVPDSSEDCLYLNVYTPSKPGANDKLPVSVTDLDEPAAFLWKYVYVF